MLFVDEIHEVVHQNYDYVFLVSLFSYIRQTLQWPAHLPLVAFTGSDINGTDLEELMQVLKLFSSTKSLKAE